MAIPTFEEAKLPVLKCLEGGNEKNISQMAAFVAKYFDLSVEDKAVRISSGEPKYRNNVGWAKTDLYQAGLILRVRRGVYVISKEGKRVLNECPNSLTRDQLIRYESFANFLDRGNKDLKHEKNRSFDSTTKSVDLSPIEQFEILQNQVNNGLAEELIETILDKDPYFFEYLVGELLKAMGYGFDIENALTVTPRTTDGGIDGIVKEDNLGFEMIYYQAKRYALGNKVTGPEIQGFIGALANKGAEKGLFITTSDFTDAARSAAKCNYKIVLINGKELVDYMIKYNVGVSTVKTYMVKEIDSDFFIE